MKEAADLQRRGLALGKQGRLTEAAACCRQALQIRPDFPEAHFCLGRVHAMAGRWGKATQCFEEALRWRPRYPAVLNRLGMALRALHRWEEAVACYRALAQLRLNQASAHRYWGEACANVGKHREALQHVERALQLKPNEPAARVHRALLWLQKGDFARGWDEYEARWLLKSNPPRVLPKPLWDGSALKGRTLLLHSEQGLGDAMQFVRYAAVLHAAGARVTTESPPALFRLLAQSPALGPLHCAGDPLPPFDVHAPLMSLPRLLRRLSPTIRAPVPYLAADMPRIARWRARLAPYPGFKVGIVWQGNPAFPNDRLRSMPLSHFETLARVPGIRLISLQQVHGVEQLAGVAGRFEVVHFGRSVDRAAGAFVDTAALMKNLDLVIACDSAAAHLAGALGVPVWLLLSVSSDWRWGLGRERSPWYPTMRIFRQHEPAGWQDVFRRLTRALAGEAGRIAADVA